MKLATALSFQTCLTLKTTCCPSTTSTSESPQRHACAAGKSNAVTGACGLHVLHCGVLYCSRYSSFLRSLSYYSFAKNPANEYVEYSHPHFRQGHPESLTNVRMLHYAIVIAYQPKELSCTGRALGLLAFPSCSLVACGECSHA